MKLLSASTAAAIDGHGATITGEAAPRAQEEYVVRFDPHQRLQHLLMMSSFIVLAATGLPQKFDDVAVSQAWVSVLGGLEMVRLIHRCAASVMLSDCLYHLAYLGYRIGLQKRLHLFRMLPSAKDARDALGTVLYFLGIASSPCSVRARAVTCPGSSRAASTGNMRTSPDPPMIAMPQNTAQ